MRSAAPHRPRRAEDIAPMKIKRQKHDLLACEGSALRSPSTDLDAPTAQPTAAPSKPRCEPARAFFSLRSPTASLSIALLSHRFALRPPTASLFALPPLRSPSLRSPTASLFALPPLRSRSRAASLPAAPCVQPCQRSTGDRRPPPGEDTSATGREDSAAGRCRRFALEAALRACPHPGCSPA
jgi:hypothetical protein